MPSEIERFKSGKTYDHRYIISVLDTDGETVLFEIENSNLVSESVVIDERLCSAETLRFGLCEGASVRFSYFGLPNIKNRRIRVAFGYTHAPGSSLSVSFQFGVFTVSSCRKHIKTGIYDVEAYDDLAGSVYEKSAYDYFLRDYFSDEKPSFFAHDIIYYIEQKLGIESDIDETDLVPITRGLNRWTSFADNKSESYYVTFNSLRGIECPFNAYRAGAQSTSQSFYPRAQIRVVYCDISKNKYYKIVDEKAGVGGMQYWYNDMFSFIRDVLNSADVTDRGTVTDDPFYYFRAIVDDYTNNQYIAGWTSLCGVWLYDGSNYTRLKTIDDYEGGQSYVDGVVTDYENCIVHGYERIYFLTLMQIGFISEFEGAIGDEIRMYQNNSATDAMISYDYRDADNHVQSNYYYVPRFEDGSWLNASDINSASFYSVYEVTNLDSIDKIELGKDAVQKSSARKLLADYYETRCVFGGLDPNGDLTEISLETGFLYPAEDLYPADNLYPGGDVEHIGREVYERLLLDDIPKKIRYLYITYMEDLVRKFVVNEAGNIDYYMDDNVFFNESISGVSGSVIIVIGNEMAEKMRDLYWIYFEMDLTGIPLLRVGDAIEIDDDEGNTYVSYILERRLKGIHDLRDSYYNGELEITL